MRGGRDLSRSCSAFNAHPERGSALTQQHLRVTCPGRFPSVSKQGEVAGGKAPQGPRAWKVGLQGIYTLTLSFF